LSEGGSQLVASAPSQSAAVQLGLTAYTSSTHALNTGQLITTTSSPPRMG